MSTTRWARCAGVQAGRRAVTAAAYPITPKLELALNIDNLFDRVYWERAGTATRSYYYGLPRSAMLTLRASF